MAAGDWLHGEMTGSGTYTYASGDEYQGHFRDSAKHGKGTYVYADGDSYTGIASTLHAVVLLHDIIIITLTVIS